MPPAGAAVEVFVFQGGKFLGSRCFSQSTIVIGSGSEATLRLRDASIAPQHALIRVEGTSVMIADNNSPTGILVNRRRTSMQAIKSFDEVTIGPFRLKVSLLGHEEEEDPGFGAEPEPPPAAAPAARAEPRQAREAPQPERQRHRRADPLLDEDEAETVVRRLGDLQDSGEATMPRIDPRGASSTRERGERVAAAAAYSPTRDAYRDERSDPYADDDLFGQADRRAVAAARPEPRPEPRPESRREQALAQTAAQPREDPSLESRIEDASVPAVGAAAAAEAPYPDAPYEGDHEGDYYDDDDEDEEPFVEPFSLLENVVRERFKTPADCDDYIRAEVIRYGNGEILDVLQAAPGRAVKLFPDDFKLVDTLGPGQARLYFKQGFSGNIVRNGKARQLTRLLRQETLVDRKRGIHAIDLQEGDYAQVVRDDAGYLVRFVKPPTVPKAKLFSGVSFGFASLQILAGSAAFHFLILVLLGFMGGESDLVVETESERFAKVALKDLKLEKPKPKKEEPKPEPPKPVKDKPKPTPKPPPTKRRVVRRTTAKQPMTAKRRAKVQKKQVSQVLSALQNLKPSGGPGRSSLKSLTTNIKAIRLPGGSSGGFKVSGVIGKLPGNAVRLASGGYGGGKGTKVGTQLLAGGKIGRIAAIKGTGTRVRGRVRRAPTRSIRASGGVLSREAIQKVVSRHMYKVQGCYERQLLTSPGLSGKIVFDWVISTSGSVASARQVSSSLRSAGVATCILREIRSWRFPQPQGGSVQVRYPFVFRVQGF